MDEKYTTKNRYRSKKFLEKLKKKIEKNRQFEKFKIYN
jgi:hypothetical protein